MGLNILPGVEPQDQARPDATAWAVTALSASGHSPKTVQAGRDWLSSQQRLDGSLILGPEENRAAWPTGPAVLAWHGSQAHLKNRTKAVEWMLSHRSEPYERHPDSPMGHDTTLPGWAWIHGTHAWVEPTALARMVLGLEGLADQPPAKKAVRLLMDRQLPMGGWNYGNRNAFGTDLYPLVQTTGVALSALSGVVPLSDMKKSLAYLTKQLPALRSPLSLGWGLLGLAAWDQRPSQADVWLAESMERQERFGNLHTEALAVVALAAVAPKGLVKALNPPEQNP